MKQRTTRDKNRIVEHKDYYEMHLYNNKSVKVGTAKIDKEDIDKVTDHKWRLDSSTNYVKAEINRKSSYLHHLVLGRREGFEIDHKNHCRTDNRKQNLRFVTRSENLMNREGKGVTWYERTKQWRARITKNQKVIHLGCFKKKKDAIKKRRQAEIKYFGEYAFDNY